MKTGNYYTVKRATRCKACMKCGYKGLPKIPRTCMKYTLGPKGGNMPRVSSPSGIALKRHPLTMENSVFCFMETVATADVHSRLADRMLQT